MTIKIFLGNLSSDTSSDAIRPLFEKYGEVVECDVLKNFGFVHMTDKNDANEAIAQLDGYNVDGKNIRVELSTGKKGGGGGGKFDKKGMRGGRDRPYGPPRGGRDFGGRDYPYPPLPPLPYDRFDPYYRYYMDREAYYARAGAYDRERYPPIPDPRDRLLPPPRSYLEDRLPPPADPYMRDREAFGARPPPEYYERKQTGLGGRGMESVGAAGAAGGRLAPPGVGGEGDYYRGAMDRPGGAMGGAAGGVSGNMYRQSPGTGQQMGMSRGGPAGGQAGYGKPDRQSSFASDPVFF